MIPSRPVRSARQAEFSIHRNINDLGRSGSVAVRAVATTAATLLIVASAGFGVTFTFYQGVHHGPALAACAVAMALGLELAKPFAVEGVFSCLRSWAFGRALAMALLGFVAVAYSLTAELSLMATTRGDAAAGRSKTAVTTKDDRAELARLTAERSGMTFTPATGETVSISREAVAAAERTRKAECGNGDPKQRGRNCRDREADEATARAALAKATAHKAATERAAKLDADAGTVRARLARTGAVASADPGASALANYLGLFGLSIPAALLSEWLVLVGVISLELGSALAVVLVRAVAPSLRAAAARPVVELRNDEAHHDTAARRDGASVPKTATRRSPKRAPLAGTRARGRTAKGQRLGPSGALSKKSRGRPARERKQAEVAILGQLKANGGTLPASSARKLGAMLNVRKSTAHSVLCALITAGIVGKVGTGLILTA